MKRHADRIKGATDSFVAKKRPSPEDTAALLSVYADAVRELAEERNVTLAALAKLSGRTSQEVLDGVRAAIEGAKSP